MIQNKNEHMFALSAIKRFKGSSKFDLVKCYGIDIGNLNLGKGN